MTTFTLQDFAFTKKKYPLELSRNVKISSKVLFFSHARIAHKMRFDDDPNKLNTQGYFHI